MSISAGGIKIPGSADGANNDPLQMRNKSVKNQWWFYEVPESLALAGPCQGGTLAWLRGPVNERDTDKSTGYILPVVAHHPVRPVIPVLHHTIRHHTMSYNTMLMGTVGR